MALPTPRVSGCRAPAGLVGIFLAGKNREIRANPTAGRAALSLRVALPAQSGTAGGGTRGYGQRDSPARGGAGGLLTGATLSSLLVPVSVPCWSQSVFTVPSLFSLWELPCAPYWCQFALLPGPSLCSLRVPVCPYWCQSCVLSSPNPSLLGPVCPHWSQFLFPMGAAVSYWFQFVFAGPSPYPCGSCSALLTGASLLSLLVPVPVPCHCLSRFRSPVHPSPGALLVPVPVPC